MKHEGPRVNDVVAVLGRTFTCLCAMLHGLPQTWVPATEGEGTCSPYDVIGHLIHSECTDWIPRARHFLAGEMRPFERFDRYPGTPGVVHALQRGRREAILCLRRAFCCPSQRVVPEETLVYELAVCEDRDGVS